MFETERIEVTNLDRGQNEAVFSIYGTRFHMLDANEEFGMTAPDGGARPTVWFNVMVPDIAKTHQKALEAGGIQVQAVNGIPDFGAANSIFTDPFGYLWMLHEIHREVSFKERMEVFQSQGSVF